MTKDQELDDPTASHPSVAVPKEVYKARVPYELACSSISANAVKVYCALHERGVLPSNCYPSYAFLAKRAHMSERTVKRAVKELVSEGWVAIVRRTNALGHRTSNGYELFYERQNQGRATGGTQDPNPNDSGSATGGTQEPKCQPVSSPSANQCHPQVPPVAQELPSNNSLKELTDIPQLSGEPESEAAGESNLNGSTTQMSSEVQDLCELLADRIEQHQDGARHKISKQWYRDMDLLLRRGACGLAKPEALSTTKIQTSIAAVFDDLSEPNGNGFCWADQIQSPRALRKHWLKMGQELKRLRVAPLPEPIAVPTGPIHEAGRCCPDGNGLIPTDDGMAQCHGLKLSEMNA